MQQLPLRKTPSLTHMDFSPDNIVTDEDRIKGIIDWDQAISADPDMEFFKAIETLKRTDKPVNSFMKGYLQKRSVNLPKKTEDLYRLQANISFLSAMHTQDKKGIDIADRNLGYSFRRINEILS